MILLGIGLFILGGNIEDYNKENTAYMYFSKADQAGYVMLFRPEASKVAEQTFFLKRLDEDTEYLVTVADAGQTVSLPGKVLTEKGISAQFPQSGSAKLLWIEKDQISHIARETPV